MVMGLLPEVLVRGFVTCLSEAVALGQGLEVANSIALTRHMWTSGYHGWPSRSWAHRGRNDPSQGNASWQGSHSWSRHPRRGFAAEAGGGQLPVGVGGGQQPAGAVAALAPGQAPGTAKEPPDRAGGAVTPQHIGFIGLGNMGSRMAANLLKAGHKLVVYDRNIAATDALAEKGAALGQDPADIASLSDIIITMLPSSPHVEDVYLGHSGILRWLPSQPPGIRPRLLIDASTIDPITTRKVAAVAAKCGLLPTSAPLITDEPHPVFLDAPVSGGVVGAEAATLTFMVGGPLPALELARPLLQAMGRSVEHCGGIGSGQVAKLCNNLALAITMAGTAEALVLGQQLGVDPLILTRILNTSSARSWSSDTYNPCPGVMDGVPSSRNYAGGFSSQLMAKDIGLALTAAKEAGAVVPMGAKVLELYLRMVDGGASHKDFSSIYEHIYGGHPARDFSAEGDPEAEKRPTVEEEPMVQGTRPEGPVQTPLPSQEQGVQVVDGS